MKCRYGFDAAHEELLRFVDKPNMTWEEKKYRSALKETTFACHYGTPPCGWEPEQPPTPIYDELREVFFRNGKTTPQGPVKKAHVHLKTQPLHEHIWEQHGEDVDGMFAGYVITGQLHEQMHEERRRRMSILQYEEGLPGVFVK